MERERLQLRLAFLRARASFHLEAREEQVMHQACAGSLLRDAGAIALLLGDVAAGSNYLVRAGETWARIGLFAGYSLLSIGESSQWWRSRRSELGAVAQELISLSRPIHDEGTIGAMNAKITLLSSSLSTPRQLLDLYVALRDVGNDDESVGVLRKHARWRLVEVPSGPIGTIRAFLPDYLALLDAAQVGELRKSDRDTLMAITFRRIEQLRAARRDTYHWRKALAPADILDFDLLAVCIAAVDSSTDEYLGEILDRDDRLVSLPLEAARALRKKQDPDPQLGVFAS